MRIHTYRFNTDHLGGDWHGSHADAYDLATLMTEAAEADGLPVEFVFDPEYFDGKEIEDEWMVDHESKVDAIWQEIIDASEPELWTR